MVKHVETGELLGMEIAAPLASTCPPNFLFAPFPAYSICVQLSSLRTPHSLLERTHSELKYHI